MIGRRDMSTPGFSAEASLYKTSGHYRTGRYTIDSSAQTVNPVWPAVINVGGEVIEIHDWGPPLTEPPVLVDWGGGGGGGRGFTGEGPGGPGGGGGDGRPRA